MTVRQAAGPQKAPPRCPEALLHMAVKTDSAGAMVPSLAAVIAPLASPFSIHANFFDTSILENLYFSDCMANVKNLNIIKHIKHTRF